ncbi:MAG: transglutaminase-like domain-containing protein [Bifidobacteriaceae bacterium]|jgi:hypothetical protein|nr:transglutaminase-like domain-containing protein [Bifidobacteriaceae bacterium]
MRLTLKRLADAVCLVLLVGLALAPLVPVFTWAALIVPTFGGLLLGGLVATLAAWRRWQPLLSLAAAAAAYLLLAPAMAVPEMARFTVLPTGRSELWLVTGLTTVWSRLLTVETPIGLGGGFGLAPFLLAYVGATVGVSLAVRLDYRRAPLAGLVPLAVSVVALVLGTAQSVAALPLGLVVGIGACLWVAWRSKTLQPRRTVALVVTVALAAGAGWVGGLAAERGQRLVVRDELVPPFDPRNYPSPLAAYRRYIKEGLRGEVLLKVADLPAGGVIKLAVMDWYDGIVWNVAGGSSGETSGNFGRMPAPDGQLGGTVVTLEDHDTSTVWLYSVGLPQAVRFAGPEAADLRETVRFNPVTGTLALPPVPPDGVTYSLTTWDGTYRPATEVIAQAEAADLVQPTSVKVRTVDMETAAVVRQAASGGAKALALEQYLQDGYYSDGQAGAGEGAGRADALAGHGASRLTELLDSDQMVGNAEQYAAVMALMARSAGLPSRVVMGFAPGYGEQAAADSSGPQGAGMPAGSYTFQGSDMTVWVEIALDGLGWVPFFPTPNRQDSPEEAQERQEPEPDKQVIQPPPPEVKPSEPPDEEMAPVPIGSARPVAQPEARFEWGPVTVTAASAVFLLLALAVLILLVVAAKARRRRRRRLDGPPVYRVVAGWEELVDQLTDMGLLDPAGGPPAARRLARRSAAQRRRRQPAAPLPSRQPAAGAATQPPATDSGAQPSGTQPSGSPDVLGLPLAVSTRLETAASVPGAAAAGLGELAIQSDAAAFSRIDLPERYAVQYWQDLADATTKLRAALGRWHRWRAKLSLKSLRRRRAEGRAASTAGRTTR